MDKIIKNKCLAIFNRPVTLPGDNWEKLMVYGLMLEADPSMITFENAAKYIEQYILPLSKVTDDNPVAGDGWCFTFEDGRKVDYHSDGWERYYVLSKDMNIRFCLVDVDYVPLDEDDLLDGFVLISKEKWMKLNDIFYKF